MNPYNSNNLQRSLYEEPNKRSYFSNVTNQASVKRHINSLWLPEYSQSKRQLTTNDNYITLTIKDKSKHDNFMDTIYLKINKATTLSKLFIDYGEYRGLNARSFNFFCNGQILNWSDTVSSCGMKEYDVISSYMIK